MNAAWKLPDGFVKSALLPDTRRRLGPGSYAAPIATLPFGPMSSRGTGTDPPSEVSKVIFDAAQEIPGTAVTVALMVAP